MNTEPVSAAQIESTRKLGSRLHSEILQRLGQFTQQRAAECMGVNPSTVSHAKDDLERICHLMAALGFQLTTSNSMVISRNELYAMKTMTFKYLQAELENWKSQ